MEVDLELPGGRNVSPLPCDIRRRFNVESERRGEDDAVSIPEDNGLYALTQISKALLCAPSFRTEVVYWLSLTARVGEI
jgi:hypothetical protein